MTISLFEEKDKEKFSHSFFSLRFLPPLQFVNPLKAKIFETARHLQGGS
jgi:hypothetical protein